MTTQTAPTVLVVDDSEANRLTMRLELADHGFEVVEAKDGNEALARLSLQTVDAVVTDIWMPGTDGIQLIQAIRRTDPGLPVIVITGGGPGLSIASASGLAEVWGALKVYVKPFDVRELARDLKQRLG